MTILLESRPLAEQAHAALRQLILTGVMKLGSPIAEEALAARLGISRTPIREALRRLTEEGLVEAGGRARARVATIDSDTADGITAVRAELDALAAATCARRGLDADALAHLRALATAVDAHVAASDLGAAFIADGAFHLALGEASGNRELCAHLARLDGRVQLLRLFRCRDSTMVRTRVGAHHRLIAAIAAGDAANAATIARGHADPSTKTR